MRLLTRSDFDGLACAALLIELDLVDSFKFVHPKDMQDGLIEVNENDVIANVPFVPGCGLWFDHHSSEEERGSLKAQYQGMSRPAPSCARVIYDYYGGQEKFGSDFDALMAAVDKADSAQFTVEEALNPTGWVLLSFVMDPRTGLGRFRNFTISNYQLMEKLAHEIRHKPIEAIMDDPDVKERVELYFEQAELFKGMIKAHSKVEQNVLITDLRGVEPIYSGNRFIPYALFPEVNISIWIVQGKLDNCVFTCGKSIFDKSSSVNIGSVMLKYGGGGHFNVGTCQVRHDEAERTLQALTAAFRDR
ncbi:exopolyphosphatase [Heliobacterium gestii]|uniref:Exopolyphosphatase n=1 Tax=Heliomicrobium gestii TaxID=2699 RepID=A0A845L8X8_HELGE|nr:exopolyphosphatase [Heliomicrobium gestii]MBM7866522.1 nanoRNase/pAp phosphatase (c-di-AMP/oligoRNAs hydrolase) [Heliomicrobium gestii]MZP43197.1 exopolyphosphatase [Heliomicrobium gestii]